MDGQTDRGREGGREGEGEGEGEGEREREGQMDRQTGRRRISHSHPSSPPPTLAKLSPHSSQP